MNGVKHWSLATIAKLVTWAVMVAGAVWIAAARSTDVDNNTTAIADHEERIRITETTQTQMATDVRWIRDSMEEDK